MKFDVLALTVASHPYKKVKGLKELKFKLDGVEITLTEGTHYHQHWKKDQSWLSDGIEKYGYNYEFYMKIL